MLDRWLSEVPRDPEPYGAFTSSDASELTPPTNDIKLYLANLLLENRLDPNLVRDLYRGLGWNRAQSVIEARMPSGLQARRGEFGEVLAMAMLEEFHGYTVPVRKVRGVVTPGQSLPGADIFGMLLDDDGVLQEVCFGESKLRTSPDTMAAVRGAEQLRDYVSQEESDILFFVTARLQERGDPLYQVTLDYMRQRDSLPESTRLFLVWEADSWTETVLQNLEDSEIDLDPFHCHVVAIDGLGALTDACFSEVGITDVTDDE